MRRILFKNVLAFLVTFTVAEKIMHSFQHFVAIDLQ